MKQKPEMGGKPVLGVTKWERAQTKPEPLLGLLTPSKAPGHSGVPRGLSQSSKAIPLRWPRGELGHLLVD